MSGERSVAEAAARSTRILIVDDDVDSADALALLFSMEGFDAAVARGGRAGIVAADDSQPHVIVTDIHMPSIDGHALAKSIRMEWPPERRPLLIAYSGIDRNDARHADYREAFDLWFTKPMDMAAIVAAVVERFGNDAATGAAIAGRSSAPSR